MVRRMIQAPDGIGSLGGKSWGFRGEGLRDREKRGNEDLSHGIMMKGKRRIHIQITYRDKMNS